MDKFAKKVFISVPMKGRTDENIIKDMIYLWKIAELRWGEQLIPVTNFFLTGGAIFNYSDHQFDDISIGDLTLLCSNPPINVPEGVCNIKMYYISEAVKKMSECDYLIGFDEAKYSGYYGGCEIENKIAIQYDMETYFVNYPGQFPWSPEDEVSCKPQVDVDIHIDKNNDFDKYMYPPCCCCCDEDEDDGK